MPFRSENQRRFLWANHPEIARRWTNEHGSKPVKPPDRSAAIKRRLEKQDPTSRIAKGEPARAGLNNRRMRKGPSDIQTKLNGAVRRRLMSKP